MEKNVFDIWRDGEDSSPARQETSVNTLPLQTGPDGCDLKPRKSLLLKREGAISGTLRRCWQAFNDTIDLFSEAWDASFEPAIKPTSGTEQPSETTHLDGEVSSLSCAASTFSSDEALPEASSHHDPGHRTYTKRRKRRHTHNRRYQTLSSVRIFSGIDHAYSTDDEGDDSNEGRRDEGDPTRDMDCRYRPRSSKTPFGLEDLSVWAVKTGDKPDPLQFLGGNELVHGQLGQASQSQCTDNDISSHDKPQNLGITYEGHGDRDTTLPQSEQTMCDDILCLMAGLGSLQDVALQDGAMSRQRQTALHRRRQSVEQQNMQSARRNRYWERYNYHARARGEPSIPPDLTVGHQAPFLSNTDYMDYCHHSNYFTLYFLVLKKHQQALIIRAWLRVRHKLPNWRAKLDTSFTAHLHEAVIASHIFVGTKPPPGIAFSQAIAHCWLSLPHAQRLMNAWQYMDVGLPLFVQSVIVEFDRLAAEQVRRIQQQQHEAPHSHPTPSQSTQHTSAPLVHGYNGLDDESGTQEISPEKTRHLLGEDLSDEILGEQRPCSPEETSPTYKLIGGKGKEPVRPSDTDPSWVSSDQPDDVSEEGGEDDAEGKLSMYPSISHPRVQALRKSVRGSAELRAEYIAREEKGVPNSPFECDEIRDADTGEPSGSVEAPFEPQDTTAEDWPVPQYAPICPAYGEPGPSTLTHGDHELDCSTAHSFGKETRSPYPRATELTRSPVALDTMSQSDQQTVPPNLKKDSQPEDLLVVKGPRSLSQYFEQYSGQEPLNSPVNDEDADRSDENIWSDMDGAFPNTHTSRAAEDKTPVQFTNPWASEFSNIGSQFAETTGGHGSNGQDVEPKPSSSSSLSSSSTSCHTPSSPRARRALPVSLDERASSWAPHTVKSSSTIGSATGRDVLARVRDAIVPHEGGSVATGVSNQLAAVEAEDGDPEQGDANVTSPSSSSSEHSDDASAPRA